MKKVLIQAIVIIVLSSCSPNKYAKIYTKPADSKLNPQYAGMTYGYLRNISNHVIIFKVRYTVESEVQKNKRSFELYPNEKALLWIEEDINKYECKVVSARITERNKYK